ncbi:MAG TPA: pitrilysin family protein [Gemmatimonadota bacterium]|nr:pitrilysin family protein [Gemmatimonadota bacterium]
MSRGILLAALTMALAVTLAVPAARAQAPDRTAPPELGPPPRFDPPDPARFTLSNGLEVLLVEKHEVPLVQVNLLVEAGSVHDPEGKTGLASMTGAMLDEGAGGRTALELADAIDYLGADVAVAVGKHSISLRLHTPLARLEAALPLLADVAIRPDFPAEELERQRAERLTTLLQWHDEPRAIAAAAFGRTLFGDAHPYGATSLGTEASLRSFSVDDLRAFHGAHFHAGNATLVVAGDVTEGAIRPLLEAAFGGWGGGTPSSSDVPEAAQVSSRAVWLVDKPGAAQSEIRIGRIGVARSAPDYEAILVMNTILGGSFTSRLNQNLREDKGYSYGAFSFFDFQPHPGPFTALAAVQTDVTAEALVEFMAELRRILETVPDEELDRARNYVALGFPEGFQTVAGIAGQMGDLALYDLAPDWYDGFVDRVLAVTREDVERVARERIDPDRVTIVVVGDLEQIEAGVRALELGPVTTMEIEEVLGPRPVLSPGD